MAKTNCSFGKGQNDEIEVSDKISKLYIDLHDEDKREVWRKQKRKGKSLNYLESLGIEFADKNVSIEDDYIKREDISRLYSAMDKLGSAYISKRNTVHLRRLWQTHKEG